MRRSWISIAIAIVAALVGTQHLIQGIIGLRGGGDPTMLTLEHWDVTIFSFVAVYAIAAGKRWAPWALAVAGISSAALVVSLGPLLSMASAERNGLWTGAMFILLFAAVGVWYLARQMRA